MIAAWKNLKQNILNVEIDREIGEESVVIVKAFSFKIWDSLSYTKLQIMFFKV